MGMRRGLPAAGALVIVLTAVAAGRAADMSMQAGAQLKGAISEARAVQAAGTLKDALVHLQAVVNCIEGPRGAMFKRMSGGMTSPCEGKGSGLLADARASGAKWAGAIPWIGQAHANAALGVKATTLARARVAGWAAQVLLERADRTMMTRQ